MGICNGNAVHDSKNMLNAPKLKIQQNGDNLNLLSSENLLDLNSYLDVGKLIGTGKNSTVEIANLKGPRKIELAIKSYPNECLKDEKFCKLLYDELKILKLLDHPNILKYHNTYRCQEKINISTENCNSGNLFGYIVMFGNIKELLAAMIARQLILTINYMHCQNIAHRDQKPSNIMFMKSGDLISLRQLDFGFSCFFNKKNQMTEILGTTPYMSPEVFKGSYTEKSDIWAIGCILYYMISGNPPFTQGDDQRTTYEIMKKKLSYIGPVWDTISPQFIEALKGMLNRNPSKRWSAEKQLKHKFLDIAVQKIHEKVDPHLDTQDKKNCILKKLKKVFNLNFVIKEFLRVFVVLMSSTEMADLYNDMFTLLDVDNDGILSMKDIESSLFPEKIDENTPNKELYQKIIFSGYRVTNGICFSEFLIAMLYDDFIEKRFMLQHYYNFLSGNENASLYDINAKTLKYWVSNRGWDLTDEEAKQHMISFCGEESITFDQIFTKYIIQE